MTAHGTGDLELAANFYWEMSDHPHFSPALAPSDFYLFPTLKEHISPLMNMSNMLLSCGWWNRDTRSMHLGWTNISYTMKSASPFKGTMLKNGILGTKCVLLVSSIKIVPLINGFCKLIFLSTFIHMQIIHTQMWHSISHTHYIKSQAHLSLHDIFCVVLTQQHDNRLYTLSIISYFS